MLSIFFLNEFDPLIKSKRNFFVGPLMRDLLISHPRIHHLTNTNEFNCQTLEEIRNSKDIYLGSLW